MPVFEIKPLIELHGWMLKLESDGDYQWTGESLSKKSWDQDSKERSCWERRRPRLLVTNTGHLGNGQAGTPALPSNVGFVGFELSRRGPTTNHSPDPQSEDRTEKGKNESAWMKSGICPPDETTHHASND